MPALYTLHVRVAECGLPDDQGFFSNVIYAVTPETKHSVHDFWVIARKTAAERPAWANRVATDFQNSVLFEDVELLEALEDESPTRRRLAGTEHQQRSRRPAVAPRLSRPSKTVLSTQYGVGLPLGRRRLVVSTVAITTVLSVLDGTISNVALPAIARDLQVSSAAVVWVVNAFQLSITMVLLALSSCSDIFGYARIYRAGVAIFVLASAGCALAHDLPTLIVARSIQGIGASAIIATSQPIARFAFPASMLGVAIGIQSMVVSISSAAGPALGGFILGVGSWPWLFWINVPFGVLALALSGLLPAMPRASHKFDWWSAVLSGAALALFITGLDQLRAPANVVAFGLEIVAAVVLGTIVVRRQSTLDPPFLAVDLLRVRIVWLSIVNSVIIFVAQNAAMIALPFFFLGFGYTSSQTGYLITPFAIGSALIALFAGRLADRYHAAILGAVGMGLFAFGMALVALLPANAAAADIVWRVLVAGVGFGLFIPPNVRAIIAAAPSHRSGAVTGLTTSARLIGSTIGVALAALIFSAGSPGGVVGGAALKASLWLAVALGVLAVAISLTRLEAASAQPP